MMTIFVEVFGTFGLTVSENKTETLLMRASEKQPEKGGSSPPQLVIEAAGEKYAQTAQFRYLGGIVSEDGELTQEVIEAAGKEYAQTAQFGYLGGIVSEDGELTQEVIEAAGEKYAQTAQFGYLGGIVSEDGELTQEINHRSKAAWACIIKFSWELFDRPRAPWRLKVRLLRAEAMEALLYGCMTWAPRRDHYRLLRRTHHRLLLRVIGYRRERGTYRQLSYVQALKKTG